MKKAEVILGFFIFLGIVLFISNYPFGAVILLLAGLMLSGFYIGYGVFLFNDISLRALLTKGTSLFRDIKVQDIMLSIISSISISILIMGGTF
ncbi:hypothetical protein [Aquimarina sp. I32.4]|uniref:hypothetical protein n=1 Tax=Aquimarina sp. I32.4 TaxID=2053903 RepID=UPI0011AF1333|nr:hypothetical protein [Aquimarina sp. I32.4]